MSTNMVEAALDKEQKCSAAGKASPPTASMSFRNRSPRLRVEIPECELQVLQRQARCQGMVLSLVGIIILGSVLLALVVAQIHPMAFHGSESSPPGDGPVGIRLNYRGPLAKELILAHPNHNSSSAGGIAESF